MTFAHLDAATVLSRGSYQRYMFRPKILAEVRKDPLLEIVICRASGFSDKVENILLIIEYSLFSLFITVKASMDFTNYFLIVYNCS